MDQDHYRNTAKIVINLKIIILDDLPNTQNNRQRHRKYQRHHYTPGTSSRVEDPRLEAVNNENKL